MTRMVFMQDDMVVDSIAEKILILEYDSNCNSHFLIYLLCHTILPGRIDFKFRQLKVGA